MRCRASKPWKECVLYKSVLDIQYDNHVILSLILTVWNQIILCEFVKKRNNQNVFSPVTMVCISHLSLACTKLSCDRLSFSRFHSLFSISSLEDNGEQSSDPQRQTRLRASPWKPWPHSPKSTCGNFFFPCTSRSVA